MNLTPANFLKNQATKQLVKTSAQSGALASALSALACISGCVTGGLFSTDTSENNSPLASNADVKIYSLGSSRSRMSLRTSAGSAAFMPLDKPSRTAALATAIVDEPLTDGGFSAVTRVFDAATGQYVANQFWTISDRGPNMEIKARKDRKGVVFASGERFFPVPNYNQGIMRVVLNADGTFDVAERIGIKRAGVLVDGLPSSVRERSTKEAAYKNFNEKAPANELPRSLNGYDFEGLRTALDANGKTVFWASEEYGPSVVKMDSQGNILQEYIPGATPTSAQSPAIFALPALLRQRRDNRGFEGLAMTRDHVVALQQSSLDPAGGRSGGPGSGNKDTRLHRLVRIHKTNGSVEMFGYNHVAKPAEFGLEHGDIKIGDMAALNPEGSKFLVYEHDGDKKFGRFYIATLDSSTTPLEESKGVAYEAGTEPYVAMRKQLVWDFTKQLQTLPLPGKLEGFEVIDSNTLLVMFDNDYCFSSENGFIFPISAEECRNTVAVLKFDKPIF